MEYIYWLSIFVWIPLVIMWIFNWKYLILYKTTFLTCIFFSFLFSVPWDIVAVRTKIWLFPIGHTLGINILGLPVEEYIFIFFVPILLVTSVLLIRRFFK